MSTTKKERLKSYKAWKRDVRLCTDCELCRHGRSQVVFDSGKPGAKLAVIGEAPGRKEDEQGKVFVGKSGQILRNLLRRADISPEKDAVLFNIIMCRPRDNKFPQDKVAKICQKHTATKFDLLRPEICILAGRQAINWVLYPETRDAKVGKSAGKLFQCSRRFPYVRYFLCVYHPAYIMRQHGDEQKQLMKSTVESFKVIREDLNSSRIPLRGEDVDPIVHRRISLFGS